MNSTTRPTRPERRATRAKECARTLHAALDRHDVTQEEAGAAIGVSQCQVSRWASPQTLDSLPLHDVGELPDVVAIDVLAPVVARLGYTLAQLPVLEGAGRGELRMLADAAREHGEALAAYVTAAETGSRGDVERAIRESDEAIRATAALRQRLVAQLDGVRMAPRAVAR